MWKVLILVQSGWCYKYRKKVTETIQEFKINGMAEGEETEKRVNRKWDRSNKTNSF